MVIFGCTSDKLSRTIKRIISLSFLTILLSSCDGNYRNIKLFGQIIDEDTNEPVSGATVKITWWVYDMSNTAWESKPILDSVKTSLDGVFKLEIKKAEAYDLVVKHLDYIDHNQSKTLNGSLLKIQVRLEPKDP